ncbi:DUF659 domain-containing protein [Cinnamomum micranthum f. kanehirae]|uniref:DUF659 domain-containing protein n=1 Tax=Cinnamomum micranthum f. kanehirae TaxID=337451 RepID=A0A443PK63_9MAGN|nr:DUF659 domain-containing protein [Cinnamomum micranthum f. kanehirae]
MERHFMENRKNKKRQLNEEIGNPHGTLVEEELEDEVAEVEELLGSPTSRNRKGKEKVAQTSAQKKSEGVAFLKSIDANGIRKNADALFSMFDEVLLSVGPEKVVQLITDNDATDKVAGWRVAEKYQTFY